MVVGCCCGCYGGFGHGGEGVNFLVVGLLDRVFVVSRFYMLWVLAVRWIFVGMMKVWSLVVDV